MKSRGQKPTHDHIRDPNEMQDPLQLWMCWPLDREDECDDRLAAHSVSSNKMHQGAESGLTTFARPMSMMMIISSRGQTIEIRVLPEHTNQMSNCRALQSLHHNSRRPRHGSQDRKVR